MAVVAETNAISADPAIIESTLTANEFDIYRDHRSAAAAEHLVVRRGNRHCYVIFRRDRRKGLPFFASILYVSNPDLFRQSVRSVSRTLLFRHGVLATLVELRLVGGRCPWSIRLRSARPKMFKSPKLTPEMIDYLYSELVLLPW